MMVDPKIAQALAIRSGLRFYKNTGRKINTAYSLTNMLRTTENITGNKYRRNQIDDAINDLDKWLDARKPNPA